MECSIAGCRSMDRERLGLRLRYTSVRGRNRLVLGRRGVDSCCEMSVFELEIGRWGALRLGTVKEGVVSGQELLFAVHARFHLSAKKIPRHQTAPHTLRGHAEASPAPTPAASTDSK
jgi:hypothetical protein